MTPPLCRPFQSTLPRRPLAPAKPQVQRAEAVADFNHESPFADVEPEHVVRLPSYAL